MKKSVVKNIIIAGCLIIILFFIVRSFNCKTVGEQASGFELFNKAERYLNDEKYKKALPIYNQIIEYDTTTGRAYYDRGFCYMNMEQLENSNIDFLKSITYNYKVANSYYYLGVNYWMLSQDSIALHYLEKAYSLNPKDRDAKSLIEHLIFKLNNYNYNY